MEKYSEDRPWGNFERFCLNERCTVKLINVKPRSELSLQYHKDREEFWKIIEGEAKLKIGDKIYDAKKGQEFYIKKRDIHQIVTQDLSVTILEISFGEFDEEDIIRLKDIYGRI